MRYQVERHSGRNADTFKIVVDTNDGNEARREYEKRAFTLRQGTVQLLIDGTVANCTSAPRLRTRW